MGALWPTRSAWPTSPASPNPDPPLSSSASARRLPSWPFRTLDIMQSPLVVNGLVIRHTSRSRQTNGTIMAPPQIFAHM